MEVEVGSRSYERHERVVASVLTAASVSVRMDSMAALSSAISSLPSAVLLSSHRAAISEASYSC